MNKNAKVIYKDSDQKHVGGVLLYAASDNHLFWDEDCTKPVTKDEALDLFLNGLIRVAYVYGGQLYYDTVDYFEDFETDGNHRINGAHGAFYFVPAETAE